MKNEVAFTAVVQLDPKKAISSTGKSARGTLTGISPEGVSFYITALFIGAALEKIKAFLAKGVSTPLIVEGIGSLVNNRFAGSDGQRVTEVLVKVGDFEEKSSRLKTVKDKKGQLRLAKGYATGVFHGAALRDSRPSGQYGQMALLKEEAEDRGAFVFSRIPSEHELSFKKGDVLQVQGRVTSLYPKGKDNKPETGIIVASVAVAGAPATSVLEQGGNTSADVPF